MALANREEPFLECVIFRIVWTAFLNDVHRAVNKFTSLQPKQILDL